MEADIRKYKALREGVRHGLTTLLVQARQIWGDRETTRLHTLDEIVVRLMVGVGDLGKFGDSKNTVIRRIVETGDLARVQRDAGDSPTGDDIPTESTGSFTRRQIKKELGNVLFSTIRWIDDLGLDVLECLDLAIEAQEKFAKSGRPR